MTSTSSTSAKLLFQDSKKRLADRIAVNLNNAGSVARQVFRGSKSSEILMQTAKSFAQMESTMDNTSQTLKKMEAIHQQLGYQYEAMNDACNHLDFVKEQVGAMQR
ncbi:uncharacterized protein LOC134826953 [Culicoides brevitarsis]|uniref:uncharacterized protein LOC134826953 n=1 Tax=Culicoides brevitarsis TaxID=469753 RepID=UPI00307CC1D0